MENKELSTELKREVIQLIVQDRIDYLSENIHNGNIKDGYEFVLRDLFTEDDWDGVAYWPGNWRLGTPFAKLVEDYNFIERIGDSSKGAALYKINKK